MHTPTHNRMVYAGRGKGEIYKELLDKGVLRNEEKGKMVQGREESPKVA